MSKKVHDFDWDLKHKVKGGYVKKFLLYPGLWIDENNKFDYNIKWNRLEFKKDNASKIPKQKGIYCFVLQPKTHRFFATRYLFYVGKTNRTLFIRFGEYIQELEGKRKSRSKIKEMLDVFDGYLYYYFTTLDTKEQVNEIEDKLIDTFVPHVNTKINLATIKPEFQNIYE